MQLSSSYCTFSSHFSKAEKHMDIHAPARLSPSSLSFPWFISPMKSFVLGLYPSASTSTPSALISVLGYIVLHNIILPPFISPPTVSVGARAALVLCFFFSSSSFRASSPAFLFSSSSFRVSMTVLWSSHVPCCGEILHSDDGC